MTKQRRHFLQSDLVIHQVLGKGVTTDMRGESIELRLTGLPLQDALNGSSA